LCIDCAVALANKRRRCEFCASKVNVYVRRWQAKKRKAALRIQRLIKAKRLSYSTLKQRTEAAQGGQPTR
jgi:hypothetical protein